MADNANSAILFQQHLDEVCARLTVAAERADCAGFVLDAGSSGTYFRDDRGIAFEPSPYFRWLAPVADCEHCVIVFTPGERPRLIYFQPADYWHLPPADPTGDWVASFDLDIVADDDALTAAIAARTSPRHAYIGPAPERLGNQFTQANPAPALHYLDYHRGTKSDYEISRMRAATRRGVSGHRAAAAAFRNGASEFDIHQAYLTASSQVQTDLPYGSIVALNRHGAALHYQHYDRSVPPEGPLSFLIDAGARDAGYACDITRTYAFAEDSEFATLIERLDAEQQALIASIRTGQRYLDLHLDMHQRVAKVLGEIGILRDPGNAVADGITRRFLPHGLGHLLGIHTHDAGGHLADDTGTPSPPPPQDPALRFVRTIEARQVFTIEPGIYFIDMLLDELRQRPEGQKVSWDVVDRLRPFGGIRIEDNIVVADNQQHENLTRDAFARTEGAAV